MGLDMYLFRVPKVDDTEQWTEFRNKAGDLVKNQQTEMPIGQLFWEIKDLYKSITSYSNYGMSSTFYVFEKAPKKVSLGPGIEAMAVNMDDPTPSEFEVSINLTNEVAYWRKFNALHRWFVENVQGGEDDCRDYVVSTEQLKELESVLKQLVNSNENEDLAEELLPTQSGFFFGGTEYDEYYWSKVEDAWVQIKSALIAADSSTSYIYCASW